MLLIFFFLLLFFFFADSNNNNNKKLNTERKLIYDALKCCLRHSLYSPVWFRIKIKISTTSPVSGTRVQSVNFRVILLNSTEKTG